MDVLSQVAVMLLVLSGAVDGAAEVPAWFEANPGNPHAVYDAWRHLSTREAVVYFGGRSDDVNEYVAAGRLVDEKGRPIANCPLMAWYSGKRLRYAHFRTDAQGYFILYGAWNPLMDKSGGADDDPRGGISFTATPGYPHSWYGRLFSKHNQDGRACSVRVMTEEPNRTFALLTCSRESKFEAKAFDRFIDLVEESVPPKATYFSMLNASPVAEQDRTSTLRRYGVRIVSPKGEPIEHAFVWASGPVQTVETDGAGEAMLELWSNHDVSPDVADAVVRALAVDVPDYSSGPAYVTLCEEEMVDVVARPGGQLRGRMIDWNGNPACVRLGVEYFEPKTRPRYLNPTLIASSSLHDGSFQLDWLMPEYRLRVMVESPLFHATQDAPQCSDWLTLEQGALREGVSIQIPMASAIRMVVLDGVTNRRVKLENVELWRDGRRETGRSAGAGLIRFSGVRPGRVKIRIKERWYESFESEPLVLEPGELQFMQVVLQRGWRFEELVDEQGAKDARRRRD